MPLTQPGEFDQVVGLLKRTTTKDRFGQHVTWALVTKVAARVTPLRGRQYLAANAMQSPPSIEVEIWYRPDIDGTWRVEWMGRFYEPVDEPIDVDAAHVSLELMCKGIAK